MSPVIVALKAFPPTIWCTCADGTFPGYSCISDMPWNRSWKSTNLNDRIESLNRKSRASESDIGMRRRSQRKRERKPLHFSKRVLEDFFKKQRLCPHKPLRVVSTQLHINTPPRLPLRTHSPFPICRDTKSERTVSHRLFSPQPSNQRSRTQSKVQLNHEPFPASIELASPILQIRSKSNRREPQFHNLNTRKSCYTLCLPAAGACDCRLLRLPKGDCRYTHAG